VDEVFGDGVPVRAAAVEPDVVLFLRWEDSEREIKRV
jgi:hypothetical protein